MRKYKTKIDHFEFTLAILEVNRINRRGLSYKYESILD